MAKYITSPEEASTRDGALRRRARRLTSTAVAIERRAGSERRSMPGLTGLLGDLFGAQIQSSANVADRPDAR